VTGRTNEVETGVNSEVEFRISLRLLFLSHVGFMLIVLRGRRDQCSSMWNEVERLTIKSTMGFQESRLLT